MTTASAILITIPLSHYCEKARWALDRVALSYREEPHAPRFGRHNPTHPHAWDFIDQPFVMTRMFGGEGNRGLGLELSWLTPLQKASAASLTEASPLALGAVKTQRTRTFSSSMGVVEDRKVT